MQSVMNLFHSVLARSQFAPKLSDSTVTRQNKILPTRLARTLEQSCSQYNANIRDRSKPDFAAIDLRRESPNSPNGSNVEWIDIKGATFVRGATGLCFWENLVCVAHQGSPGTNQDFVLLDPNSGFEQVSEGYLPATADVLCFSRQTKIMLRLPSMESKTTLPLPNFLIIGAQKSATRWLRRNLGDHPQIFTAGTELSFFNSHRFEWGLDWYRTNFDGWSDESFVGEATPAYMMWRENPAETAARVDRSLPNVKLMAVLRNPVDRTYSAFVHHIGRGRIPADADLLDWVRSVPPEHDKLGLIGGGWYAASLEPYFERFGDRLRVFLYEEVLYSPDRVYSQALEHVGATPDFVPPKLARVRLSGKLPDDSPYATGNGARRKLTHDERTELCTYFEQDTKRLEELLGRNLSVWRPDS